MKRRPHRGRLPFLNLVLKIGKWPRSSRSPGGNEPRRMGTSSGVLRGCCRGCRGRTKRAARRPPSIPGWSRRSGRIPALPYPPIKHFYGTAGGGFSKEKSIHSATKKREKPGGLGG